MTKGVCRFFLVFLALFGVAGVVCAQSTKSGGTNGSAAPEKERSVDEAYLDEPMNVAVMKEFAASSNEGNKMAALDLIQTYINQGNTGQEVVGMLRNLALEGILNKTTTNGRISNDFPDVRARAINMLGNCGADAVPVILTAMTSEREPNVQCEAVNALVKIGVADKPDAVAKVSRTFRTFDAGNFDDRLAMSVLAMYRELIDAQKMDSAQYYQDLVNIANSPVYQFPVRQTAQRLLNEMTGATASSGR